MIPIRAGFELLRGACHLLGFLTEGSDNTPHARLKSGALSSGRKRRPRRAEIFALPRRQFRSQFFVAGILAKGLPIRLPL